MLAPVRGPVARLFVVAGLFHLAFSRHLTGFEGLVDRLLTSKRCAHLLSYFGANRLELRNGSKLNPNFPLARISNGSH